MECKWCGKETTSKKGICNYCIKHKNVLAPYVHNFCGGDITIKERYLYCTTCGTMCVLKEELVRPEDRGKTRFLEKINFWIWKNINIKIFDIR